MDPITILVTALSAGAVAGLKDTATAAVKDAYAGLKKVFSQHFPGVNTASLENHPSDPKRREILTEDLQDASKNASIDANSEVVRKAKELLAAIEKADPGALRTIGVNLTNASVGSLEISGIAAKAATATGVEAPGLRSTGSVVIKDVNVGPDAEKKTPN